MLTLRSGKGIRKRPVYIESDSGQTQDSNSTNSIDCDTSRTNEHDGPVTGAPQQCGDACSSIATFSLANTLHEILWVLCCTSIAHGSELD